MVAGVVGPAFCPRYYAVVLTYYRRKDYSDKKHPEGIVTVENIRSDRGEQLGERLSLLDHPDNLKMFGQLVVGGCARCDRAIRA